jgi:hypothetical protein
MAGVSPGSLYGVTIKKLAPCMRLQGSGSAIILAGSLGAILGASVI